MEVAVVRSPFNTQDPCPTWIGMLRFCVNKAGVATAGEANAKIQIKVRHDIAMSEIQFLLRSLEMVPIFPTSLLSISWVVVYRWLKDDAFSDLLRNRCI